MHPVDLVIFSTIGSELQDKQKTWRSIGPSKIANRVRSAGYTVQVINFATVLSYDDLKQIADIYVGKDTIIGVSTTFMFGTHYTSRVYDNLANLIKEYKQQHNCKVILGGPNPEYLKETFHGDILVKGFAENKIVEVIDQIKNYGISKKVIEPWNIISCNHRWHESDRIQPGETLPLEIGRGCIFKCSYCKFEYLGKKRGEYVRDMSLIRDELIENYEKYSVTNYMLMDDTFNDDTYKIEQWCKMVDDLPFKLQYASYCRADLLHRYQDLAKELHRTGLLGCTIGLESMNTKAAKAMGKAWSAKHAKDFIPYYVHDICKGRTLTQLNFMIGLPGDTIDDVWSWLRWAKENKIPSAVAQPLFITNPRLFPNENVYSDMDLNAETKYGYRFPSASQPIMWENDIMTWGKAMRESRKMIDYVVSNFTDFAWSGFASMSLGYTLDDILSTTNLEFYNDPNYNIRTQKWFDDYKKSMIG